MGTITEVMKNAIKSSSVVKKEIYVDGIFDYVYLVDTISSNVVIHSLYCSDDDSWGDDVKGKMVIQLMDDGNGVEINNLDLCKQIEYLELEQLHILLRLHSSQSKYEISDPSAKKQF